MRSKHGRRESGPARSRAPTAGLSRRIDPTSLVPALIVVVLSAGCLALGYFWDDYLFLTFRGTGDPRVYLLPDPGAAFYRPIPQSLYFLGLGWIDPRSGIAGHVINLLVLAATAWLFTSLVTKLAGARAGLAGGIAFASVGCLPSLVAWVSCCQDLFAIAFFVLALWLRHERRNVPALAAAVCAVLSKEAAVALLPILVIWDWLIGRRPFRVVHHAAMYGTLLLLWASIHPGFRTLFTRGFRSGATGYVGLGNPEHSAIWLGRYVLTLCNVPITGTRTTWPEGWAPYTAIALALVLWGVLRGDKGSARLGAGHTLPPQRLAAIASLLLLLPLILPSLLIQLWAPYYATLGALGIGVGVAGLLARVRAPWVILLLGLYLTLGVWCRGMRSPTEAVWSEPVFADASHAARTVEANFKRLHSTLPGPTQVLLLVTSTGSRGIRSTLLEAQALRVWYANPKIVTLEPEKRRADASRELLVRITSNLDVLEVDPWDMRIVWSGSGSPQPTEVSRLIRAYARGLAATGRWEDAVGMLRRLASLEKDEEQAYDKRLVAMVLLAAGRSEEAAREMAGAAPFPYETRLEIVRKLLSEPSSSAPLDFCAFEAFELPASDPNVTRYLMRHFADDNLDAQALQFAHRLQDQVRGDPESADVIRTIQSKRRL